MHLALVILQIIFSVSLIGVILLQSGEGGFSAGIGGSEFRTKRGAERIVFSLTIILASLFLLTSILSLVVR